MSRAGSKTQGERKRDWQLSQGSPAIPRVGPKLVPIGPQRLGLFGRLYRPLRNTKYGRLLLELTTRTLGCLILAGPQHPGPLRGPPTAGPALAMTNLPQEDPVAREPGFR